MNPIAYARTADIEQAIALVSSSPAHTFLAGGTTLVDLMRQNVMQPAAVVDINHLPMAAIDELPDGGLRIGALARMAEVAEHELVKRKYPLVSEALLLGASAQLRNMASMGGNMLQRVRCSYFRDAVSPCNKRQPGSGCAAIGGVNRGHAVLGVSDACIATHPSDVAVPLVALDAKIVTKGPNGKRSIPIDAFFLLPGETPDREHPLDHGELITAIEIPPAPIAVQSTYLKVRDRESYEFALVSVAAAADLANGVLREVRLALGGVATKPWRARIAENDLRGKPPSRDTFRAAAAAEMAHATPQPMNAFKVELGIRSIVRALETVTRKGEA